MTAPRKPRTRVDPNARTSVVFVRVTPAEHAAMKLAAEQARRRIRAQARRALP